MSSKPVALSLALLTAMACAPHVLAATAPAAPASAQAPAQHGKFQRHRGMNLLQQLDLTDAQRSTIHQLMQQNFQQARPEMEAVRTKRQAYLATKPDSPQYQSATNELAQAESNAIHARVLRESALRARIYGVLTPAQRTKLASIEAQRTERMRNWRESHMRHPLPQTPAAPASSR